MVAEPVMSRLVKLGLIGTSMFIIGLTRWERQWFSLAGRHEALSTECFTFRELSWIPKPAHLIDYEWWLDWWCFQILSCYADHRIQCWGHQSIIHVGYLFWAHPEKRQHQFIIRLIFSTQQETTLNAINCMISTNSMSIPIIFILSTRTRL